MFILQVFSPAKVIFAGVGVLLLVRILSDTLSMAILYLRFLGSQGCSGKPRHPCGHFRADRSLFPTDRNLHQGAADSGNDGYHHADFSRGTLDSWDCDEGDEAGDNEWVIFIKLCHD